MRDVGRGTRDTAAADADGGCSAPTASSAFPPTDPGPPQAVGPPQMGAGPGALLGGGAALGRSPSRQPAHPAAALGPPSAHVRPSGAPRSHCIRSQP